MKALVSDCRRRGALLIGSPDEVAEHHDSNKGKRSKCGAFVAVAAVVLIVDMLVAMFTVHAPHGFNFINITGMGKQGPVFGMPGAEVNLLYIAGLLALVIAGTGAWSVDTLLQDRKGPASTHSLSVGPASSGYQRGAKSTRTSRRYVGTCCYR